ncbi:MAG: LCP family protein [Anaerolineales bacterium]|nr:LCP family protein [Anaerolineales bacterium]
MSGPLPPPPPHDYARVQRIRARRSTKLPTWLLGGMVALFAVATVLAGYLVFSSVRDIVGSWQIGSNPGFDPEGPASSSTPGAGQDPGEEGVGNGILPQKWQGKSRVTVLLLGIDRRQGETERAYRTDSIMLISIDPVANTASMLSIPRDLWVEMPDGYDPNTINTANFIGDAYELPGGGPAFAMKTIRNNLGVSVDYYVRLDFTAFEKIIDAIGGIEIDNPTEIDDPEYPDGSYGYEPFYLSAGVHTLNGHDALRYARTRHDDSDINRAQRQQQVVLAVRDKVLSVGSLPTLLAQAPGLYSTLQESIQTNLTIEQMIALALLAQDIPRDSIKSGVIDYRYVTEEWTAEGRQVLMPIRDEIRQLRDELFAIDAAIAPVNQSINIDVVRAEGAGIQVLNGSGLQGLAGITSDWLGTQGLTMFTPGNADRSDYQSSVIIDYSGNAHPNTLQWLQNAFNVATVISASNPPDAAIDIQVIVGQDWSLPGAATTTP